MTGANSFPGTAEEAELTNPFPSRDAGSLFWIRVKATGDVCLGKWTFTYSASGASDVIWSWEDVESFGFDGCDEYSDEDVEILGPEIVRPEKTDG